MIRQAIQSSNINSVGYEAETQTLEVEFLNGRVYSFFNVPLEVYRALFDGPSFGKQFNAIVKGRFSYTEGRTS